MANDSHTNVVPAMLPVAPPPPTSFTCTIQHNATDSPCPLQPLYANDAPLQYQMHLTVITDDCERTKQQWPLLIKLMQPLPCNPAAITLPMPPACNTSNNVPDPFSSEPTPVLQQCIHGIQSAPHHTHSQCEWLQQCWLLIVELT